MIAVAAISAALLAYLGLGWFAESLVRAAAPRPRPKLEQVRDERADITTAIDRSRR